MTMMVMMTIKDNNKQTNKDSSHILQCQGCLEDTRPQSQKAPKSNSNLLYHSFKLSEFPFLYPKNKKNEEYKLRKAAAEINLAVLMKTPGTQACFTNVHSLLSIQSIVHCDLNQRTGSPAGADPGFTAFAPAYSQSTSI